MVPYNRRSWLSHLLTLRGSVVPNIVPRLAVILLVAVLIHLLAQYRIARLSLPSTFHTLLGTGLSLLVAFRTNTAYDRFWEGRKAWGAIVNRSRNVARRLVNGVRDPAAVGPLLRLVVAFVHGAKRHLWDDPTAPEVERLLGPEAAARLAVAPGPSQRALLELGAEVTRLRREGTLDSIDQLRIEEDISILLDQLGVCQRIKRTPIPFAYVVHLHRLLFIYCLTLPCALLDQPDWRDLMIVALVSYGLLGIEQIGVEIEDPFEHTLNDIDLESISATIERDVLAYGADPGPGA